jgi:hypothetical protein
MRIPIYLSLAWLLSPGLAFAQAPATPAPAKASGWEVFSRYVQLRKAFDGGKGETEAAAVGFIAPGKNSQSYWLVDAGVRPTPINVPFNNNGTFETFFFPSVEWHHMDAEPLQKQDATNKVVGGFNAELWLPPVTGFNFREIIIGKATLQRNFIKDNTENSVMIALESCAEGVETHENGGWEGGFRPCAELTYDGARRLHYYPYVGYEHYAKVAISSSSATLAPAFEGSMLLLRVQGDAYPFNTSAIPSEIRGLVLNFEYSYRRLVDEHPDLDFRDLHMLKFGATYFFVKDQAAGIGLTMDVGRSPAVNFIDQRRIALALRLKTKS